jgi:hypothetical protein
MDTIRRIGRYTVPVEIFTDVVAELKLVVAPEGRELPPDEELEALEAQERTAAEPAPAAAEPEAEPALAEAEGPAEIDVAVAEAEAEAGDDPNPG